jgi:hypothetical protein
MRPVCPRLAPLPFAVLLAACPGGSADLDEDGFRAVDDCDDSDPLSYPGAEEVVGDGIDQDCSGADTVLCFYDGDQDGFGFGTVPNQRDEDGVCDDDPLQATAGSDCDDARADIRPGAPEVLDDGLDQDCSGRDRVTCFPDADDDGVGSDVLTVTAEWPCVEAGHQPEAGDCDDGRPDVYLGAEEVIGEGIDQDCNGADTVACWVDIDQDGFGAPVVELADDGTCDLADSESDNDEDCDDSRADISPLGVEVPDDSIDQDCNGADARTCYLDGDGDGFGAGDEVVNPLGGCGETPGFSW